MSVHAPSVLLALWLIAWSSLRAQPQEVALTWIAGHEAELHVAPCRAGTAPSRLWLTRSMGEPFGDWEEPCPDLSPAGPSRFRFKVPAVTTPTTFRFGAWEASGEQGPCQGSLEVWPPLRVRATLEAADAGRRCLVPGSLARLRARRVDGEAWRRCTWVLLGAPPTALLAHGDEALFTAPPVTRPTCFRIQVRDSAHPEDLAELGLPVVPDPDALPWRWAKIISKSGSRNQSVRLGRRDDAQPDLRSWTSPERQGAARPGYGQIEPGRSPWWDPMG